jgi:hypothetical protein
VAASDLEDRFDGQNAWPGKRWSATVDIVGARRLADVNIW